MNADCYFCHMKTVKNLVKKFEPEKDLADDFMASIHEYLSNNKDENNPTLATGIHRIAKDKLNITDLYANEKHHSNNDLLAGYSYWRNYIDNSDDPFYTAIRLAVVGNIIDYGAHSLCGDLNEQINSLLARPLKIDKAKALMQAINEAKSILYLGDNAGEVFFDKLLIETIHHPNLTFVTRGYPVINDITLDDAKQVGVDKICKVISNGYDAPSTLLEFCSDEFIEQYNSADLIISKGQGNFEGLLNEKHPNTYFLLIAKCEPMADLIGCEKNDMIVTKLTIN